ncbi:MAG TPA: cation:proton antiporter [Rhizomicrobium sp.]|jgi:CPA1 family monovalent cation:H+ antiporter|nr:cation:proton antiporter [Rhizomicrobium sp.]
MTPFELTAILMTLVAGAGWINARTLRMPHGVAMLGLGILVALALFALRGAHAARSVTEGVFGAVSHIDFVTAVVGIMLPFLLFAGAMQVDLVELRRRWLSVGALATLGVVGAVVVVGFGTWAIARALGIALPLSWALVFGALISPTDPVAVLATVKHGKLSKTLQVVLEGEALFNDGVGIVAFTALVAVATGSGNADPLHAVLTVVVEALGGLALGVVAALGTIRLMQAIDEFAVEVGMTIALAMLVYAAAQWLHLSGAIAVVGAGMMFGGERGKHAIAGQTEVHMKSFWSLVDEILNALLFLLLGVEMLIVPFAPAQLWLILSVVVLVVAARFAVVLPWGAYFRLRLAERGATLILGWGGLHGALSLALALSLGAGPERTLILALTYAVVAFSITVQGLTFTPLTRWLQRD